MTNLLLLLVLSALPSQYDNNAKYIYDPILREFVGYDLLNERKSSYINTNSSILIGMLKELSENSDSSTIKDISSQISSITSQKEHLANLLQKVHFRRNKRTIELNLEIIGILESINIQVNRIESMPLDYATRLKELRLRIDETSKALEIQSNSLERNFELQEKYRKELDEHVKEQSASLNLAKRTEIAQLAVNIRSLASEIDMQRSQVERINEEISQIQSESGALEEYGDKMKVNINSVQEINYLLGLLDAKMKKSRDYVLEETKIIRLRSSLWFIP